MKVKHLGWDLFLTFFKVGLFTFGGGYAMISMIENICVSKKQWISHDEMMEVTVIAESTPGPIAINCATFVGYKQMNMLGAFLSTLGIVAPSFLIIYFISCFFDNFLEIQIIASAFLGIKVGVAILIIDAALKMMKKMGNKKRPKLFMGTAFLLMLVVQIFHLSISSVVIMLLMGVVSLGMTKTGGVKG